MHGFLWELELHVQNLAEHGKGVRVLFLNHNLLAFSS